VQIDPTKSQLKPPETKRLKLKRDILLSNYTFTFDLRRYALAGGRVEISGAVSSQYLTALLMSSPLSTGRGCFQNKHSTDDSKPKAKVNAHMMVWGSVGHQESVRMSIHPECQLCSELG